MAADIPALHWLEGVWRCTERRNQVFPELAICFSLSGWDCISGREIFSDDKCVKYGEALLDCLRCHKGDEKILGQLQCFFWDNFKFPADIDSLGLSPAEKHILKEMLSIMFLPSDYDDFVTCCLILAESAPINGEQYQRQRAISLCGNSAR